MLSEGRLPLNAAEHDAVDTLISKSRGRPVALTRRDPGDTGPLVVEVGKTVYEVDEHGKAVKQ